MIKKIIFILGLIFTSSLMAASPTFTGLYNFENNANDSSGNGNNGTVSGTWSYVTISPLPLAGSYFSLASAGGNVSIPTTVFTAGMVSSKVASAGVSFFCTESQFSVSSGLISWTGTGGDGLLYTDWAGGNREIVVKIGSSGGTQSFETGVETWEPGRWYDVWMDIYPTRVDAYLYDWAAHTQVKLGTITTTVSLAGISQVNIGSYNGVNEAAMCLDNGWFASTNVTTDPFVGASNYDVGLATPKRTYAVVHLGDSSIMGYGCTPTASNYYYVGGERPEMEVDSYGNTYNPVFYSIGTQEMATNDPALISIASPMNEGYSGQVSDYALTDLQANYTQIFNGISSGRSVIFILGGFHGDTVAGFGTGSPYSEAKVRTNIDALDTFINTNWPDAKIVIEDNYLIQGGAGVTQNLGMADAYADGVAAGLPVYHLDAANPASLYYFGIANATGNCADTTHPMKGSPGYLTMGDAVYNFLLSITKLAPSSVCQ